MSLMVWGHRGHRHHRYKSSFGESIRIPYENSLLSYRQVLEAASGLECDVVQSQQKTPFLVHDTIFDGIVRYEFRKHLSEASQNIVGDRFIFQLSDSEIGKLYLKDGQNVPKLESLLGLMPDYPGRMLNLELKGPGVADTAVRQVEKAILQKKLVPGQVVFSSYNLPALRMLRSNVGTRFRIGVFFTMAQQSLSQMYPNWPLAEQNAYYVPFSVDALQRSDISEIQPDFFNIEINSLNVETIEAMHHFYPDAKLILWTIGEEHPQENSFVTDMLETYLPSDKVFAIITDFPEALQQALQQRGIETGNPDFYKGSVAS